MPKIENDYRERLNYAIFDADLRHFTPSPILKKYTGLNYTNLGYLPQNLGEIE